MDQKKLLKAKIRHWEAKGTKKGNRYASHYRWILKRLEANV